MRCYRKILCISYKDHVGNEEVSAKIQQAIGPREDLLAIVKRRRLQWYGHVSLSSGLAKTISQSTVKGGRRQGRQRKRWEDNTREWAGLEFAKSQRAVENREKWRKLVVKLSVVPHCPSWLKDRWWWWWYDTLLINICVTVVKKERERERRRKKERKTKLIFFSMVGGLLSFLSTFNGRRTLLTVTMMLWNLLLFWLLSS